MIGCRSCRLVGKSPICYGVEACGHWVVLSNAMVLLHLMAILILVCLHRLMILCMCREVTVKVAHFVIFPAFVGV